MMLPYAGAMTERYWVGAASPPTIVCVGTVTLDMILSTPRVPAEDERVEADRAGLVSGGNAATAAVAIARLGLPVEFCGTVGTDLAGDLVAAELAAEGIGTRFLRRSPDVSTAQSAVLVSSRNGSRAIVTLPAPTPPPVPQGFDIVHVDKAGWSAIPAGGLGGSLISVDDGNLIPDLDLSLLTWFVPTASTLRERFGTRDAVDAARRARSAGAAVVVATSGADGSFGLDESGLHAASALPVRPVSTLGAGDVFHGALVAAVALGEPLWSAIRFANVTAALSCRALDGRSGIPRIDEVRTVLRRLDPDNQGEAQITARFSASDDAAT